MRKIGLLLLISLSAWSQSTEITPGSVLPQMTTVQRTSFLNPPEGMMVFDSDSKSYWFRQNAAWVELANGPNFWKQEGLGGNEIKTNNEGGFWSENPVGLDDSSTPVATVPKAGNGTRLMWIPAMSAFRAGSVSLNSGRWDASNIGLFSFAAGANTLAKGKYSAAFGELSGSLGRGSFSVGDRSVAYTDGGFAGGKSSLAVGPYSIAYGYKTRSGEKAVAMGDSSMAFGVGSFAAGKHNLVEGDYSAAIGLNNKAPGYNSFAVGEKSEANGSNSIALGQFSITEGLHSIAIGYGDSSLANRSYTFGNTNTVVGESSMAFGRFSNINGQYAISVGSHNLADAYGSYIFGKESVTRGVNSFAIGRNNEANGFTSMALGISSKTMGDFSTTLGFGITAKAYGAITLGMYNDTTETANPSVPLPSDRIFQIGNGEEGLHYITLSNAITVLRNGNTGIGVTDPYNKLEVNGFTKLGESAPGIKMKDFTSYLTSNVDGGTTNIPHGLASSSKIVGIQVYVYSLASGGLWVHENYGNAADSEFNYTFDDNNVVIRLKNGNCTNIRNTNIKMLITYRP